MIAPAHFSATSNPARASSSRQMAIHDAGLVDRFNAGDGDAFAEIMFRYRQRMFSVALAMLHNHADAEEITQDTFIRAHHGLAKFRGEASLATWLHRIALNLARNRYWYYFRRRQHATLSLDCAFSDDNPATLADLVASDSADPVREALVGEFNELVATCMERLNAPQREILTLRNSLHRTYGEIAQELGISIGTVKSRIARARESLRVLLVETCPEFGSEAQAETWFDPVRPADGVQSIGA